MRQPPTDLQVLEEIYRRYYPTFAAFNKESPSRRTKIFVPIDIKEISRTFEIDPDIIFGRLYYHLEPKYRFEQPDGLKVHFFTLAAGEDRHCVQFPLLAAVIAKLREERNRDLFTRWLSVVAIAVSVASLFVSVLSRGLH
jgi:hypothetical protein